MGMSVYIAGASAVKVDRHFSKSYKDLVTEVLKDLHRQVGINSVDFIVVSNVFSDCILEQLDLSSILTQSLGLTPTPAVRVETGESSGLTAVNYAYSLIKSGRASSVLVIGVEKLTEYPTHVINKYTSRFLDYEVEAINDITPVNEAAILMDLYMRRYNYGREDLVSWPIKMHENAVKNPHAQLRFSITKEQVLRSQTLSEPIKLLDSYPIGDGAAAILITSSVLLPHINSPYVELVNVLQSTGIPIYLRGDLLELPASKLLFRRLSSEVKVDLSDSVIEVHDSYTILGYLIIEELGLVSKGNAPKAIDGLSNINLSGGLKARGHPVGATGVYQLAEVYKILTTGLGSIRYNARWGVVHSMSAIDNNAAVAVVRRID